MPPPPPLPPPGGAKAKADGGKVRKWADPMATVEDNWMDTTTPVADLFSINWSTLDKVATSDSGSAGVIFCRCASGAFVIKGCATVAQEMFSAQLARVLGVAAPRARLLSWPGNDWQMLQKNMKRHFLRRELNEPSAATVRRKVEKELDRPHILVFELVPGVGLDSLPPQELAEKLTRNDGVREIGAVCALDCILNNADRLPLLWNNNGNAANLMFCEPQHQVVAIDQAAFSVPAGAGRDDYLRSVRQLCEELCVASTPSPTVARMCRTLHMESAVNLDPSGEGTAVPLLDDGLRSILRRAACLSARDVEMLWHATDDLSRIEGDPWGTVWEDSMKLVSCEFIVAVLDAIREYFAPADANAEEVASVRAAISSAVQWVNGTMPPEGALEPEPEPEQQLTYPPPLPPAKRVGPPVIERSEHGAGPAPPPPPPPLRQTIGNGVPVPPPPPPAHPQPRNSGHAAATPARGPNPGLEQALAGLRKTAGPPPPRPLADTAVAETLAPRVPYMKAFSEARASGCSGVVEMEPSGAGSPVSVKVLVLQKCSVDGDELDATLTDARQTNRGGRPVDIVVLPEGGLHEAGEPTRVGNDTLRELCAVVAKHRCWAVLGTMIEIVKGNRATAIDSTGGEAEVEDKYYATAVVVGPDGEIAHTYRKRAIPNDNSTLSKGTSVGVFETEFGRVGVLICYDSEDDQVVQELLDVEPVLVINPIHISAGRTGGASGGTDQTLAKWRVACHSMCRRMDYLVANSKSCCGWVRADQPYPVGLGSSMAVSRFKTEFVPVMTDAIWPVEIPLDTRQMLIAPPPRRARTDKWDNCGTRYTRRSAALLAKVDGVVPISCTFVEGCDTQDSAPSPTGNLSVLFSDGSCDSLDVSRLHVEATDATTATDTGEASLLCDAEREAREQLQQLLQEHLGTTVLSGRDQSADSYFAAPVRLEPPPPAAERSQQGFYLTSFPVSSGMLNLCRWERDATSQLQVETHHSFDAGPLGASAIDYDWRRGRLAIVSAIPLRSLTRDRACVMERRQPVASLRIARHRFVASILEISQHRQQLSLSSLLA